MIKPKSDVRVRYTVAVTDASVSPDDLLNIVGDYAIDLRKPLDYLAGGLD